MRVWGVCLVLAVAAGPGAAQFAGPTVCTGTMEFRNADGTTETYLLTMDFDGPAYMIRAVNPEREETTEDSGTCADYLAQGCRHGFAPAGAPSEGHYDFRLEARGAGRYFYTETWSDGFAGQTMLDCRGAAGRP